MAAIIAQKSCTTVLPLWSLRKMIYQKGKEKHKEETQKALKGILLFKYRKNKNKKYTYPDYGLSFLFKRNYRYPLQFHLIS